MELHFLTPLAALFALGAALPLAMFVGRERRARRVRATLGLAHPPRRPRVALLLALAGVPALAAAAAAQPLLDFARERHERVDVEGFVVLDTSRSMLAASGPEAPTRFERAQALARGLRDALPEIPLGLASLTDRTLPHLFPTTDGAVFDSAVATSLGVEKPGPRFWFSERATDLNALAAVVGRKFFAPERAKRLLVVLTDGESRDPPAELLATLADAEGLELVVVPIWAEGERVYTAGVPESAYQADPNGPATLRRLAAEAGGRLVERERLEDLVAAVAEAAGAGPTRVVAEEGRELPLMPYLALAALLPAAFLLRRRNL